MDLSLLEVEELDAISKYKQEEQNPTNMCQRNKWKKVIIKIQFFTNELPQWDTNTEFWYRHFRIPGAELRRDEAMDCP